MRIAVIIPVYNEARWVRLSVERVLAAHPEQGRDVILVDDGSTDGASQVVDALAAQHGVHAVHHPRNLGKGAAIRTGIAAALARGADAAIIHDADLEYDPMDHHDVLAPIRDGRADAVVGSRFIGLTHRVLYYWHSVANRFITEVCNMTTNLNLTDVECCSKAFTRPVLERIAIEEDRFGVEIELVAKVAAMRLPDGNSLRRARVYEVAVSYAGRTYEEGKKITWRDGAAALWCIFKYAFRGHPAPQGRTP